MLWSAMLIGFVTSASLAVAIGPQNAFILRQGLKREHVLKIVLFCSVSDFLLMACGVYGLASIVSYAPYLLPAMKWGGSFFLFYYGLLSLRRALGSESMSLATKDKLPSTLKVIFLQLLAFTYLNPHVYMDTVLLLGSIAQSQPSLGKFSFLLGTAAGSFAWFFALGYGASILVPLFKKEAAWKILDVIIGLTMCIIAGTLLIKF